MIFLHNTNHLAVDSNTEDCCRKLPFCYCGKYNNLENHLSVKKLIYHKVPNFGTLYQGVSVKVTGHITYINTSKEE